MEPHTVEAVRVAAATLADAVAAAEAEGFVIAWPGRATELRSIAITETGSVVTAKAEEPEIIADETAATDTSAIRSTAVTVFDAVG